MSFDTFLKATPEEIDRVSKKVVSQVMAMAKVSPIAVEVIMGDLNDPRWMFRPAQGVGPDPR